VASIVQKLEQKGLLNSPPSFLKNGVQLEVLMGSVAYGVANDTSDMDIYGFCVQQHHIEDKEARKEYDVCIYSVVKFFQLCMENNPNMVDALFVPRRCVLYSTAMGELVRENRRLFLSKACWPKFKGYAYAQLHKMRTKKPEGSRIAIIEEYGYDVKFAYHVVRLLNEVEQILLSGDLDLECNREQLKAIRRGEWSMDKISAHFEEKEKVLEAAYHQSSLPHSPDEKAIRRLLLECLEHHYGSLDAVVQRDDKAGNVLKQIHQLTKEFS